ncbi:MAG: outer membrane lipoprotein carrier protein LolA [Bacteroidales bacterium]|nr:outer membrane lipoprotein carrier protein LolA [Bacteroidales bacterium]
MKTKNIIASLLLLFAAQVVTAQNSADVLVRAFVDQIKSHKNVEMTFSYQFSPDGKNFSEAENGKAWLQGESYKIEMAEQHNISDGKTIWTYLIDEEEVMVSDATEGTDNTPLKLFTSLDESYVATLASIDAKGIATVELANPKGQYKRVSLKIDTKKNEVKTADIYMEDGSRLTLHIEELKFDQKLDEKFFNFDEKAHPNVDVIDMR